MPPASTPTQRVRRVSLPEADWGMLRLLNQYRFLLIAILGTVFWLVSGQQSFGTRAPLLFQLTLLGYLLLTGLFVWRVRMRRPTLGTQFYLQHYFDILLITLLMHASGGISSGLGTLLLISIALLSLLSSARHAMLFAAIATTFLLSESLYSINTLGTWAVDLQHTAMLSLMLFVVAWLLSGPLRRMSRQSLSLGTHSRITLDAEDIAALNEAIIREIDSGVLVLDRHGQVVLLNDSARALLSAERAPLPIELAQLCPELWRNLNDARGQSDLNAQPFTVQQTRQDILPRYAPLGAESMLIRLDDHAAIRQQFQQLKLASLGRLSASIAHEIRNPLGAVSQSLQLLDESDALDATDRHLVSIALNNSARINRIVEDILQLSNREQICRNSIDIASQLEEFVERFSTEHSAEQVDVELECDQNLMAAFDTVHLDQVLWNLCSNAIFHNQPEKVHIRLIAFKPGSGDIVIDIIDDGRGIAMQDREQMFEPFYSTHHAGCGLGLYIIRELCELNKATITLLDTERGAHFRLRLSSLSAQSPVDDRNAA